MVRGAQRPGGSIDDSIECACQTRASSGGSIVCAVDTASEGDGDTLKLACLLVLAESADARQHEIIVFPDDGDERELEFLYGNLSEASYNLGIAYRAMGDQISPNASRIAFIAATRAREIGERCRMRENAHADLVTST